MVTIVFRCHNDVPALRRSLWALAVRAPASPFEVVLIDEGSEDNPVGELRTFSSRFPWKYLRLGEGEKKIEDFIAHDTIIEQCPHVIAWGDTYNKLLAEAGTYVAAEVYEIPKENVAFLDPYGSNLCEGLVALCERYPLYTPYTLCEPQLMLTRKGFKENVVFAKGAIGIHQGGFAHRKPSSVTTVAEVLSNV